jgi:EAL domain-containing protein (putative c-di-GMP-specific phosphodiesterase class I)
VNLSTRDLQDPELAAQLAAAMDEAGIDRALVELEVTDLVVMGEDALAPVLHDLKKLGVRLAIDDFGTGNSVLGRLHHCPLDTLKIDRSFITVAGEAGGEIPLVRALVSLAHSLDLTVIAEGVETASQLDMLRRYGCDIGQGYLFGKPMPAADLDLLLLSCGAVAASH